MDQKPHVFVVGFPRSGTTLLKRLIESHSSFAVDAAGQPAGSMFYSPETQLFPLTYQHRLKVDAWDKRIVAFFNDSDAFARFADSVKTVLFMQRHLLRWLMPYRYFNALLSRVGSHPIRHMLRRVYYVASLNKLVIERFFYHAARARGGQRLMEKTPYHYEYISEILLSYPEAKIIFISRHPLDVFSSYRKRAQIDKRWSDIPIARYCSQYRDCYAWIAWRSARSPNSLISVPYERLVQHPQATFGEVCAFIGEEFEEKCLTGDRSLKGPEWDPNVHADIIKKTKSWRDYMTMEEAANIETRLFEVMSRFGYEKRV